MPADAWSDGHDGGPPARDRRGGPADRSHISHNQAQQFRTAELRHVFARTNQCARRRRSVRLQMNRTEETIPVPNEASCVKEFGRSVSGRLRAACQLPSVTFCDHLEADKLKRRHRSSALGLGAGEPATDKQKEAPGIHMAALPASRSRHPRAQAVGPTDRRCEIGTADGCPA
jgi:hypothetical protein